MLRSSCQRPNTFSYAFHARTLSSTIWMSVWSQIGACLIECNSLDHWLTHNDRCVEKEGGRREGAEEGWAHGDAQGTETLRRREGQHTQPRSSAWLLNSGVAGHACRRAGTATREGRQVWRREGAMAGAQIGAQGGCRGAAQKRPSVETSRPLQKQAFK